MEVDTMSQDYNNVINICQYVHCLREKPQYYMYLYQAFSWSLVGQQGSPSSSVDSWTLPESLLWGTYRWDGLCWCPRARWWGDGSEA